MNKTLALIIGILGGILALAGVALHLTLTAGVWIGSVLVLAGIVLFIILAAFHFRQLMTLATRRQTKLGVNTVLLSLIVLTILALINFLSSRHNLKHDTTKEKLFTISPKTVKVLKEMDAEVTLTAFFKFKTPEHQKFQDLIREYQRYSRLLQVTEIDPDKEPALAQKFGITQYGTTVFESQGKTIKVKELSESQLTNTLIKITRKEQKKLCFLEGHGEKDIDDQEKNGYSQLKEALEEEGYQDRKLLLMAEESVPEDCILLVIANPQKPILPHESDAIHSFVESGGNLLLLADPDGAPGLEAIAARYGINLEEGYVIENSSWIIGGGPTMPLINRYAGHEITEEFGLATLFSTVRPVKKIEDTEHLVLELAQTGEQSFVKKAILPGEKIRFDPASDAPGPISVAAVSTVKPSSEQKPTSRGPDLNSRVVVFGDSDFAANSFFSFSGNGDLALNTVNWLAQEKDLISIRPKARAPSTVHLTPRRSKLISYLTVYLIPFGILFLGIGIWWRRRRK